MDRLGPRHEADVLVAGRGAVTRGCRGVHGRPRGPTGPSRSDHHRRLPRLRLGHRRRVRIRCAVLLRSLRAGRICPARRRRTRDQNGRPALDRAVQRSSPARSCGPGSSSSVRRCRRSASPATSGRSRSSATGRRPRISPRPRRCGRSASPVARPPRRRRVGNASSSTIDMTAQACGACAYGRRPEEMARNLWRMSNDSTPAPEHQPLTVEAAKIVQALLAVAAMCQSIGT
jgi:hypothetical protein